MNWQLINSDVVDGLRQLPDESVHCCVTSPPYFNLRDYGTAQWLGGDPECNHSVGNQVADSKAPGAISMGVRPGADASQCRKCGAKRLDRQIGIESTPDEYIAKLVEAFREVRRVLRRDGTCWINIGDSYAGSWGAQGRRESPATISRNQINNHPKRASHTGTIRQSGLKPKDLIGIPWMLAFALRADGWYLRQDIIWSKPNPMPESVQDRCTKSHEYIFLLSKSAKYFYDNDPIKEPAITGFNGSSFTSTYDVETKPSLGLGQRIDTGNRNRRSVWSIATQPNPEPHFASFPEELPEICIKAGSPEDGIVLDPFAGTSTTGIVALRLGRKFIGIDLSEKYCEISERRLKEAERQAIGDLFMNIQPEVSQPSLI